jgi:hypothetical protein
VRGVQSHREWQQKHYGQHTFSDVVRFKIKLPLQAENAKCSVGPGKETFGVASETSKEKGWAVSFVRGSYVEPMTKQKAEPPLSR